MNYAEQTNKLCIRAVLRGKRIGTYTVYVFENLDTKNDSGRFIMTTKCPNWNGSDIDLYQEGFLSYQKVVGGVDKWYDPVSEQFYYYKHTANYFSDFVPVTHVILGGRVVEQQKLIVT